MDLATNPNLDDSLIAEAVEVETPRNKGVVDWLLSCPEKGFFVPIESESTDT